MSEWDSSRGYGLHGSDTYNEEGTTLMSGDEQRKRPTTSSFLKKWFCYFGLSFGSDNEDEDPPYERRVTRNVIDAQDCIRSYPENVDVPHLDSNIRFYRNEIKSIPNGDFIEQILTSWKGNYDLLERHHGYIQWLFPIRERGMNGAAQELLPHEAEQITGDAKTKERVLLAFELMLDFYGMMFDRENNVVSRADNYTERYFHLATSFHNWMRITRILQSLSELGWEELQKPWICLLIEEVYNTKELAPCAKSLVNYWIPVVKKDEHRNDLLAIVLEYSTIDDRNTDLNLF